MKVTYHMARILPLISIVVSLLSFFGCVTTIIRPTREQLARADYGPYPEKFETIVKEYMYSRLKDPDRATYKSQGTPYVMWIAGMAPGSFEYLYGITCLINAKNGFGGYVGATKHLFLIRDNQVVSSKPVFE